MDAVGNKAGGQLVPGQEALDDVIMSGQRRRGVVSQMSGKTGACLDRTVNFGIACVSVAQGSVDALTDGFRNEFRRSRPFWGQCHEAYPASGGALKAVKLGNRQCMNRFGLMGASESGQSRDP